jgi:hypothetical protein
MLGVRYLDLPDVGRSPYNTFVIGSDTGSQGVVELSGGMWSHGNRPILMVVIPHVSSIAGIAAPLDKWVGD